MPEPAEMTTAERELEDAIDCAGGAREDDEIVAVQAGHVRWALDEIARLRRPDGAVVVDRAQPPFVFDDDDTPDLVGSTGAVIAREDATPTPDAASPLVEGGVVERLFWAIAPFVQPGVPNETVKAKLLSALPVRVAGREDLAEAIRTSWQRHGCVTDLARTSRGRQLLVDSAVNEALAYVAKSNGPRQAETEGSATSRGVTAGDFAKAIERAWRQAAKSTPALGESDRFLLAGVAALGVHAETLTPPDQGGQVAAEQAGLVSLGWAQRNTRTGRHHLGRLFKTRDEAAKECYLDSDHIVSFEPVEIFAARPPATAGEEG